MLVVIPVVLVKAESGYAVKPQHLVPKNNSVSTGGRSGPPRRGGFVNEHEVRPNIQNQRKIRQARADTAVRPYTEDLEPNTK